MIRTIHVAFKTAKVRNAGTNSAPVLTINQGDVDVLEYTFPSETGMQEGSTVYFTFDVPESELNLTNYYIRLGIRGADAWLPEYVFVWVEKDPQYLGDPPIQPLALKVIATEELSTNEREGKLSVPLSRAFNGGFYSQIQFLFILIKTADHVYAGTQSPVWLTVRNKTDVALRVPIQGPDIANHSGMYLGNFGVNPFFFADLKSIELSIEGKDAWMPQQVMIFGYQQQFSEQKSMSPLVYIKDWKQAGLPQMSTDSNEGQASVLLYQTYIL